MKSPWTLLWRPKNWLPGLVFTLAYLITLLPYRMQMRIGKGLGLLLFRFPLGRGKRVARTNLALCFPHLSEKKRQLLLKKNCLNIGMGLIETALAWFGKKKKLPLLTIHGIEHWQACHAAQQPIMLLSAHFTCLEIAGRLTAEHLPLSIVYRPQKIQFLDYLVRYYRKKIYSAIISRDNLRQVIHRLKSGDTLWYTPDIDAGIQNSIFVPFFGTAAATITTPARLAERTGAVCLGCFFYRKKDLSGYELFFTPPLENFPSQDAASDAYTVNQLIEQAIKKSPAQYLWQYKRFKTRPNNEPGIYG
jgi:Kdo2-lipid IVA lauroyltransferase/acyltransferase